jgi:hypothetical protein
LVVGVVAVVDGSDGTAGGPGADLFGSRQRGGVDDFDRVEVGSEPVEEHLPISSAAHSSGNTSLSGVRE